jgi:DNA-binding XRE family transcriptional regulator
MKEKNMKKIKKRPASAGFFSDKAVKKILADPQRYRSIETKMNYFEVMEDIETMRKAEGISQNELAKKTGISQEELSRIEHGKRNITFDTYFRIIGELGYRPEIKYHKTHGK